MPARRAALVVSPLLRFTEWCFSPLAPGVDLFLGLLASCWFALMIGRPAIFNQGSFVGMQWLPDAAWIAFVGLTAALHFVGLTRLHAIPLRVTAGLFSSWFWVLIAISFARVVVSTGLFTYALIGGMALVSTIYISGRPRRGA